MPDETNVPPFDSREILCDRAGCNERATVIVQTERRNTGTVISYWCEWHAPVSVQTWEIS